MQKDFGLHKGGVFLPDNSANIASPSPHSSVSYSSVVPSYHVKEHSGRGQHGKFSITSNVKRSKSLSPTPMKGVSETKMSANEDETPRKATRQSWLGSKKKKESNGDRISGVGGLKITNGIGVASMAAPSPILHTRAMTSVGWDPSGRAQLNPGELKDEERMKYSYEIPTEPVSGLYAHSRL